MAIFGFQVALSNPMWRDVIQGLVPSSEAFLTSNAVNGQTPLFKAVKLNTEI